MYDELVEALRLCVKYDNAMDALMNAEQAADAIEELSRRETPMKITEIHVDEYYCPNCGADMREKER